MISDKSNAHVQDNVSQTPVFATYMRDELNFLNRYVCSSIQLIPCHFIRNLNESYFFYFSQYVYSTGDFQSNGSLKFPTREMSQPGLFGAVAVACVSDSIIQCCDLNLWLENLNLRFGTSILLLANLIIGN